MADTSYLKNEVERFVRGELERRFSQSFTSRRLKLVTDGNHEFDAVSEDGKIVVSIKASSGLTSGGHLPSGKFNDNIAELYFLSLVEAEQRILVVTSPSFHQLLIRKLRDRVAPGLSIECISLPDEIQSDVDAVVLKASREMNQVAEAVAAESEIT